MCVAKIDSIFQKCVRWITFVRLCVCVDSRQIIFVAVFRDRDFFSLHFVMYLLTVCRLFGKNVLFECQR